MGDLAGGGMLAACVKKALSTSGFSLKTGKNAKGQTTVNLTGHVTVETQAEVPIELYSAPYEAEGEPVLPASLLEEEEP